MESSEFITNPNPNPNPNWEGGMETSEFITGDMNLQRCHAISDSLLGVLFHTPFLGFGLCSGLELELELDLGLGFGLAFGLGLGLRIELGLGVPS